MENKRMYLFLFNVFFSNWAKGNLKGFSKQYN